MKVLFVSGWYPTEANPLKGTFVKRHAQALKAAGTDVWVLAICINPSAEFFEKRIVHLTDSGIKTSIIDIRSRFYKIYHLRLFWQYRLLRSVYEKDIFPEFKPELVHSNVIYPGGILGHWLSSDKALPHVITEHWSRLSHFMKTSLYAGFGKRAFRDCAFVTVVSKNLKQRMKEFKPEEKIAVVPNVVNTGTFYFKEKKKEPGFFTFVCIAHWRNPKRPDLIFESLEAFSKETSEKLKLIVVGEGELLDLLKEKNWGFQIEYVGNKQPEEICGLLHRSDFFLHASDMETFSIVTAEALSTGTPAMVSNAGALPELVNEENGLLCKNNVEEWKNGLKMLVQKKLDHAQISRKIQGFSLEEIGKKFNEVYRSALG